MGLTMLILTVLVAPHGFAQSSSASYKVEESFFGTGGELDASSPNYRSKQAAGELTVGNTVSANYQFQAGFNTSNQPLLEFAVNGGTYDLGILDANTTGAVTPTFTVRNYLSSGYIVRVNGSSPTVTSGTTPHALAVLATPNGSTPGIEQFGINLVNNSNPDVGADPVQVPNSTFGFGAAVAGYDTPNLYKFVDGDTIAFSNKSSGQTNYTMSVIANVTRYTPAGQYGGKLNVQVIPTF
jgi:hypothetical protein